MTSLEKSQKRTFRTKVVNAKITDLFVNVKRSENIFADFVRKRTLFCSSTHQILFNLYHHFIFCHRNKIFSLEMRFLVTSENIWLTYATLKIDTNWIFIATFRGEKLLFSIFFFFLLLFNKLKIIFCLIFRRINFFRTKLCKYRQKNDYNEHLVRKMNSFSHFHSISVWMKTTIFALFSLFNTKECK